MQRQKTDDRGNVNLDNKICGLASLTINHISVDASNCLERTINYYIRKLAVMCSKRGVLSSQDTKIEKIKNEKALPNFSNITINGIGIYVRKADVVIGRKGRDLYHIESMKNIE